MCVPLTQAVKYVTAHEAGDTKSVNSLLLPYPISQTAEVIPQE